MLADASVAIMAPFIALLVYVLAFWIGYRVVIVAVRTGVRQALGLAEDADFKGALSAAIAEALAEHAGVDAGGADDAIDEPAAAADAAADPAAADATAADTTAADGVESLSE
jgi:hypothetical protein